MDKKYLARGRNFSIEDFIVDGRLSYYKDRLFFIQHLMPYCLFVDKFIGRKVLEIGIGDGFGSFYLQKNGLEVTALDIDYEAGQLLNKQYLERCSIKINFVNGDATNLPFKDNSFDGVITCQVIEHIPEDYIVNFLKEIKRVLKKEGSCLISTLNLEHNVKNPKTYQKFCQHHKEFTKDSLENTLKEVFDKIELLGLELTLKHRLFRRLKKWGLMKYKFRHNPVINFYDNVTPSYFIFSPKINKQTVDLIAFCRK